MDYLQGDAVTKNIEKQFKAAQGIVRQYHRGVITLEDRHNAVYNIFRNGYFKYVEESFRFNLNQRVWDSFLEEYHMTEQGIPLDELKGESWLNSKQWDDVNKIWVPASASDRAQVLRLMQTFHIPPEYYTPLPEDISVPHVQSHPSGGNPCTSVTISFECKDDGGLLSCGDPCGKIFTLRDKLGLEAVITIRDIFSEPKEVLHNRAFASYFGEGYIEGYTEMSSQRQDPRLYIGLWKGKIDNFIAFISDADNRAYRRCPIWQDYFRYCETNQAILNKMLDSFLSEFL